MKTGTDASAKPANSDESVARAGAWQKRLETFSTILVAVASIVMIVWVVGEWRRVPRPKPRPVPTEPISIVGAPVLGHPDAQRVIIEYSDFECPYCGSFARESMPKLVAEFIATGKARFVFRQHPLGRIHPFAFHAAEAVLCAGRQDRFWEMHDSLFADQAHLDEVSLIRRASELGLDRMTFRACLNGEVADQVRSETSEAETLQLSSTPTFVIGTLRSSTVVSGADYNAVARALRGSPRAATVRLLAGAILGLGIIAALSAWLRRATVDSSVVLAAGRGL